MIEARRARVLIIARSKATAMFFRTSYHEHTGASAFDRSIDGKHGNIIMGLVLIFRKKGRTKTGARRPAPFDKPRDSVHKDVLALVMKRFKHLALEEGILVCWACAVPVVDQIHGGSTAHPATDDGSSFVA